MGEYDDDQEMPMGTMVGDVSDEYERASGGVSARAVAPAVVICVCERLCSMPISVHISFGHLHPRTPLAQDKQKQIVYARMIIYDIKE